MFPQRDLQGLPLNLSLFRTDFIITASQDGHVKFWKKREDEGIEFVKHFGVISV